MSISSKSNSFMIANLIGNDNNNLIKSEPQQPITPSAPFGNITNRFTPTYMAHSTPELLQNYYALYANRLAKTNGAELNIFANNLQRYYQLNSSGSSSNASSLSPASSFNSPVSIVSRKRLLDYSKVSVDDTDGSDIDIDEENDLENIPPAKYIRIQAPREKKEWSCETCHKTFDRPSLLQRHIRVHTGERPHACDVCGKAFSTSSSLNTHRRIHSGEKPHSCNICGKSFTASSNLYYHKLTHTTDKPHKCTKCSKSFSTPGDLRGHMHTHNGTWPFRCEVCNRGFTKQTNLKNHLLTHTGAKPFSCLRCDKQFSLACNLKSHMKTHHGEF